VVGYRSFPQISFLSALARKGVFAMNREYDIFERLPDGSVVWRAFVQGLEPARSKLGALASSSKNEFFAIHTPTKDIVVRVNVSEQPPS
jgi:hypothetical protein